MEKQLWANDLVDSPNPSLQIHAYDLVRWQPWGAQAWQEAELLDKPVLIGLSFMGNYRTRAWQKACLQDTLVAEMINRYYVPVLIDQEEHPDLAYYFRQKANRLGVPSSSWPLTLLALPDGAIAQALPFDNRSGWVQQVHNFGSLYQDDPSAGKQLALQEITSFPVVGQDSFHLRSKPAAPVTWQSATEQLLAQVHPIFGGWPQVQVGQQPLAPVLAHLLRCYSRVGDSVSIQKTLLSLDQMAMGAIYDHLGGGFFSRCTDVAWRHPRFTKRLSDQAQLISLFAQAYQLTGQDRYAQVVYETLSLVEGQLLGEIDGYYASLAAASEGENGRYYLWPLIEVEAILLDQAELYCRYYNITQSGNWSQGKSIPYRRLTEAEGAAAYGVPLPEWQHLIETLDSRMAQARARRLLPPRDQKQVVAWNALMVSAWVDAYRALDDRSFLDRALATADFLRLSCRQNDGGLYRYLVEGSGQGKGYLADYAYVARAFLDLYQVTQDRRWVDQTKDLLGYAIPRFYRAERGQFEFQPLAGTPPGVPKIRVDEVIYPDLPQAEAVMVGCMLELHQYLDLPSYQRSARGAILIQRQKMLEANLGEVAWLSLQQDEELGRPELLIVDPSAAENLPRSLQQGYWPGHLWSSGDLARQKLRANGQVPNEAPLWFRRRWDEPFKPYPSWEAWLATQP